MALPNHIWASGGVAWLSVMSIYGQKGHCLGSVVDEREGDVACMLCPYMGIEAWPVAALVERGGVAFLSTPYMGKRGRGLSGVPYMGWGLSLA